MLQYEINQLDYFELFSKYQEINFEKVQPKLKVAVLADFATQQLIIILKTIFHVNNFDIEIYEAQFDSIELEIINESSGLYLFKPDLVIILQSIQKLRSKFYSTNLHKKNFTDDEKQKFSNQIHLIKNRLNSVILHSNYIEPVENIFGNFDSKTNESLLNTTRILNQYFSEEAMGKNYLHILDMEKVASYFGRKLFLDETLWYHSKSPCSLEYIPYIAQGIVDFVVASKVKTVKCVILDLDNTLWGGVIGDDGLEGISLGHFSDGEAFIDFQYFLLNLKKRGIILAVCSKNDESNARLPFQEHPEMILRENDISIFVANWNNKADNIRYIQKTLNIGFDTIVFLDDNPFERNLVREILPDVIIPELPEDPALYVRHISELNLFETVSFTEEDKERGEMYRVEIERQNLQKSYQNIEEYLNSLSMTISLKRFDSFNLPRIVQLIQRSNQFNLTTMRYNEVECENFMNDSENFFPFYCKLNDKFGDYGLISVVIVKQKNKYFFIDSWIMSCRVLARGVEQFIMNKIFELAKQKNIQKIKGSYVPTSKNSMVKDFYLQFGFKKTSEELDGTIFWELAVDEYSSKKTQLNEGDL